MQTVRRFLGCEVVGDVVEHKMWCSWCFSLSTFVVASTSNTTRNRLRCQKCARSGTRCRVCIFPSFSTAQISGTVTRVFTAASANISRSNKHGSIDSAARDLGSETAAESGSAGDPEGAVARGDGQRCCAHDGTIPATVQTFRRLRLLLDMAASDAGIDVPGAIRLAAKHGATKIRHESHSVADSSLVSANSVVGRNIEHKTASLPDFSEDRVAAMEALAQFAANTGVERWCSWCFTKTRHALLTKSFVGRHVFRCTGPACAAGGRLRRTLKCYRCRDGMARGSEGVGIAEGSSFLTYDDETCFVCDGHLKPVSKDQPAQANLVMKSEARADESIAAKDLSVTNPGDLQAVMNAPASAQESGQGLSKQQTNDITPNAGVMSSGGDSDITPSEIGVASDAAKSRGDERCKTSGAGPAEAGPLPVLRSGASDPSAPAIEPSTGDAIAALAVDSVVYPQIPIEEPPQHEPKVAAGTKERGRRRTKRHVKRPFRWGDLSQEECVRQTSRRGKWCSWCFQSCDHLFQRKSVLSANRSIYCCLGCGERTLSCTTCDRAMTRGGAGWDDLRCAACSGDKAMKAAPGIHFASATAEQASKLSQPSEQLVSREVRQEKQWMSLFRLRHAFYEKPRTRERVCAELCRASLQRDAARKANLLRPFLLLVSMPPATRNRVACQLGWTTITQESFGNAHLEAWEILSSPQMGLQGRCTQSWERFNPFAGKCSWYLLLKRVWETAFPTAPFPDTLIERAKALESSEEQRPSDADGPTATGAANALSLLEAELEESFLSNLSLLWRENLTDVQREQMDSLMLAASQATPGRSTGRSDVDAIVALQERMSHNSGISRQEVLNYGVSIVQSVWDVTTLRMFLLAVTFSQTMIPALAPAAAPVLASAAFLATPLFVLGIYELVTGGVKLAAGSSEGRCIGPVSLILQQRLLLGAEDIRCEDFLGVSELVDSLDGRLAILGDEETATTKGDVTCNGSKAGDEK